jgi:hypothetical protein
MEFQMVREIMAKIKMGHSLGIFINRLSTINRDPKVSDILKKCNLSKIERFPNRGKLPKNHNAIPEMSKLYEMRSLILSSSS